MRKIMSKIVLEVYCVVFALKKMYHSFCVEWPWPFRYFSFFILDSLCILCSNNCGMSCLVRLRQKSITINGVFWLKRNDLHSCKVLDKQQFITAKLLNYRMNICLKINSFWGIFEGLCLFCRNTDFKEHLWVAVPKYLSLLRTAK